MPSISHPVEPCPRCGGEHKSLEFKQFVNHSGDADWSHWSTCPHTQEPICLRVAGGDYLPGVAQVHSAHEEWAAEIRAIVVGPGTPLDKLRRISESLDRAGVAEIPPPTAAAQ